MSDSRNPSTNGSLPPTVGLFGGPLTEADYDSLRSRWIHRKVADSAHLRRITSFDALAIVGQKKGNFAGMLIPYLDPITGHVWEYRIRRDSPDQEPLPDGTFKAIGRYVGPPGRPSRAYFPPGLPPPLLTDATVPIVITEGEFKCLALWRLANHDTMTPRFLPISFAGVWNWKGTIGKRGGPNGERLDVKGPISDLDLINWKARQVIIAFDADLAGNSKVRSARWSLSQELRGRGAIVGNLEWPAEKGKGIDDRLAAHGPAEVLDDLKAVDFNRTTGWRAELQVNHYGQPKGNLFNVVKTLRKAPEWHGVLAYDTFHAKLVTLAPAPWPGAAARANWGHFEELQTVYWMQAQGIPVAAETVSQAVEIVSRDQSFHDVQNYLDGLEWDGTRRLDNWLIEYCGAAPEEINSAFGSKWLISAVARIFRPGAKVDHALILEGKQGIGKSQVFKILAGDWLTDNLSPNLTDKDAAMQLAGVWIVELAELDALSKSETSAIKAFLTRQTDRYRPPYGRKTEDIPRHCVFAGTVNQDNYLKDETGNRRFWPVKCGDALDLESLSRDRDQLWAEAVDRFRSGATWWLDRPDLIAHASAAQEDRTDVDPWLPMVDAWIQLRTSFTSEEVLADCLEKPAKDWTRADRMRIGAVAKALGWTRVKVRRANSTSWEYRKP